MTWLIRVPASSANLGPGFDSVGLALPFYLTVQASLSEQWSISNLTSHLPEVADPSSHLIVQTAIWTAKQYGQTLSPCSLVLSSEIPLTRGLGSSASAIVAGILLANEVAKLEIPLQEKLRLATHLEGHPDNVAASIYGNCVVAAVSEENVDIVNFDATMFQWLVAIPSFELKTEDARDALPDNYKRPYAIQAAAMSNMLIASLAKGDAASVGYYMEQDQFHEPFRLDLIQHARSYKIAAKSIGAYGTAISGAGPTLISLVPEKFPLDLLKAKFPEFDYHLVKTCEDGASVHTKQYT